MPSIIKISTVFALLTAAHARIDTLNERNLVARSYPIGESSYASTDDSKAGTDSPKKSPAKKSSGKKSASKSGSKSSGSKSGSKSVPKSGTKSRSKSGTKSRSKSGSKSGTKSGSKSGSKPKHHNNDDQAYTPAAASIPQGYTDADVKPVKAEDYSSDVPVDTPAPVGEPTKSRSKSGSKSGPKSHSKSGSKSVPKSGTKSRSKSGSKSGTKSGSKSGSKPKQHNKDDQAYTPAAASIPQGYTDTDVKPVKAEDCSSDVPVDTPAPVETPAPVGEPADVHISPIGDNQGYSSTYPETEVKIDQAGSGDDTSGLADTIDTSNESPTVTDSMSEMEETTIAEPSAYPDDSSSDSGILDSSATTVSFIGFAGLISLFFV